MAVRPIGSKLLLSKRFSAFQLLLVQNTFLTAMTRLRDILPSDDAKGGHKLDTYMARLEFDRVGSHFLLSVFKNNDAV